MSLLQKLFGTGKKRLSKVDYWKKWEFFELLDDLHIARKVCEQGTVSKKTKEHEDLLLVLKDEIDSIEFGNKNDLTEIWNLFSPGGQWEIAMKETEIKDRIFKRADRWKKASRQ